MKDNKLCMYPLKSLGGTYSSSCLKRILCIIDKSFRTKHISSTGLNLDEPSCDKYLLNMKMKNRNSLITDRTIRLFSRSIVLCPWLYMTTDLARYFLSARKKCLLFLITSSI